MRESLTKYKETPREEFRELPDEFPDVGYLPEDLIEFIDRKIDERSNEKARLLYGIKEKEHSTNLIVKSIDGKFDNIMARLEHLEHKISELNKASKPGIKKLQDIGLSDRDQEVLDFVALKKRACAKDLQKRFKYKGSNAASARLSKLFKEGMLEKIYIGRSVYYTIKSV